MKNSIFNKLKILKKRYEDLENLLSDVKVISNQEHFREINKEYSQLSILIHYFNKWLITQKDIENIKTLLNDSELHDIALIELSQVTNNALLLEKQINIFLLPKDPDDNRSCFVEIRAGTGGHEASIFAGDLFRMYSRYAEFNKWNVEIINSNYGEQGGYKEIIVKIIGKEVYGKLKFESGGHRVQRIPDTESQGRIHTSTCTVAVMPELPSAELPPINTSDLKIDTFRSSGAGGQHVNTTDSAIRITHLPTGITVECQDERSQHKNKAKALTILGARIHKLEKLKRQKKESLTRRNLLGSGDRSDRIRTYNFPQNRMTDHRINLTTYRLEDIMNGRIDDLIESIQHEYHIDQLDNLYE